MDIIKSKGDDGLGSTGKHWQRLWLPENLTALQRWIENDNIDSETKHDAAQHFLRNAAYGIERNGAILQLLLNSSYGNPDYREPRSERNLLSYAVGTSTEIVEIFVNSGRSDLNSRDAQGRTPLSHAVQYGRSDVVRMLLGNSQVDPDSRDGNGRTPLSYAVDLHHSEIVELLLNREEVDPDSRDVNGRTPLSWAAQTNVKDTTIARNLLGMTNVKPNSKDNRGITPLQWALEYGNVGVAELSGGDGRLHKGSEEHNGLDIDARYLAHWQNSCSEQHGQRCEPSPIQHRLPHQFPDWVIDTKEGCLVPGNKVPRYIALSYVWPSAGSAADANATKRPILTERSLQDFQERSYMHKEVFACLAPAIKDAIDLLQKYGERYLWVDCLCIVQDSERTRSQVDNMGEIYSGAYLTIISATESGRLSTRKQSKSYHGTLKRLCNKLSVSKWASRGWTFQEQMLSKRAIIFLDGDIFWDCQSCVWNTDDLTPESISSTKFIRPYYEAAQRMLTSLEPDLGTYIEMVSLYNS